MYRFVLLAGVIAMVLPATASAELPPLIPREVLFGNPDKAGPQISPDGKHIAYLAPDDKNVLQVWVKPVGAGEARKITSDEKRGIRQYFWAQDNKHLLYLQDKGGDENFHLFASELATGKTRDLTPFEGVRAQGVDLVVTREPGGTAVGEAVRGVVLDAANNELCAESELLLMFASRAQLVRQVIEPALAAGRWVLCDRFTDASYAYQGGGRGQPAERIAELERWAAAGLKPDTTLLLDLPVSTGRARAAGRGEADRIEVEGDAFFERVRGAYRDRAAAEPARFRLLDASATPEAVLAQAIASLAHLFAGSAP